MIHWELSVLVWKNEELGIVDLECEVLRTWASWCLEHEGEEEEIILDHKDEEESNGLDDIPF